MTDVEKLFIQALIAVYFINLGYGFEGSFIRLKDYVFVSQAFTGLNEETARLGANRFADTWIGNVPIAFPKDYLAGIDLQRKDFESLNTEFYLDGKWSKTGGWYYYLYALALKVPLGTWLLLLLASAIRCFRSLSIERRDEFVLLAPAVSILALVSSQTGINSHMRYALPILPFFFIWIGRTICGVYGRNNCSGLSSQKLRGVHLSFVTVALCLSISSSLYSYPHSLSYFNEIAGGPQGGWKHLNGSNVDWAQDLLFLRSWLDGHREAIQTHCYVFSPASLDYLGLNDESQSSEAISSDTEDAQIAPGWYTVSANELIGNDNHDRRFLRFRQQTPMDRIGYSIFVFHVVK